MRPESVKKHTYFVTTVGEGAEPRIETQNLRGAGLMEVQKLKVIGYFQCQILLLQTEEIVVDPQGTEGKRVDTEEMEGKAVAPGVMEKVLAMPQEEQMPKKEELPLEEEDQTLERLKQSLGLLNQINPLVKSWTTCSKYPMSV